MRQWRWDREKSTMPDLLIEDLEPDLIERLERQAARHGRSLEAEAKAILEAVVKVPSTPKLSMREARETAKEWHRRLAGQMSSDSADLIREDRDR
jgi:antitoxin FitA